MKIFQRGQSMVLVKKSNFFFCVSQANQAMLSRPEKVPFKIVQKIEFFQRGQSVVFVTKSNFFIMYVFLANPARKIVFYLPHKNRMLYRQEKLSFQKVQKIGILQGGGGGPCFLSKNRTFDHVCFFGKSIQKISFFDILL